MNHNEFEKTVMGNILDYQKTLSKMLEPLNDLSPTAKQINEQIKKFQTFNGSLTQIENIQTLTNQLKETLSKVPETCLKVKLPFENIGIPKITVTYPSCKNIPTIPENKYLSLVRKQQKEIINLKEELNNLKAEIKAEPKKIRKNHTGSNEKTTQRELNKRHCYEIYDEMMKSCPFMPVSEIKKVIGAKLHLTRKTINEYLRERP